MARRHAEPEALPDSLSSHKKQKHAHETSQSPLLAYHYVITAIIPLLSDGDVLTRLLVTGRAFKPALLNYRLKQTLCVNRLHLITELAQHSPYLPVYTVRVRGLVVVKPLDYLTVSMMPALEDIVFGNFNKPLVPEVLPSSIKRITLPYTYASKISPGALPNGIKSLIFIHDRGDNSLIQRYDAPLPKLELGVFPDSLTELQLGWRFDDVFEAGVLPSSLEILRLGGMFNRPVQPGIIPASVTSTSFGEDFNQPLTRVSFPSCLKSLKLGHWFNQSIDGSMLPSSLTELELGCGFSMPLTLPTSITKLTLARSLARINVIGSLSSLTELVLGVDDQPLQAGVLPLGLTKLSLRQPITLGSIPESVTYLSYDYWSSIPVGAIPSSVKRLTLSHCNHPLLPGVIPDSVTHLKLDHMKCAIITRSLPSSVRELTLGRYFVQKLTPDLLPDNLIKCIYRDFGDTPAVSANISWIDL